MTVQTRPDGQRVIHIDPATRVARSAGAPRSFAATTAILLQFQCFLLFLPQDLRIPLFAFLDAQAILRLALILLRELLRRLLAIALPLVTA